MPQGDYHMSVFKLQRFSSVLILRFDIDYAFYSFALLFGMLAIPGNASARYT